MLASFTIVLIKIFEETSCFALANKIVVSTLCWPVAKIEVNTKKIKPQAIFDKI
jgi:hypothetical protein